MAYIEWTDNLNTGIALIDKQHKELVDCLNELNDAIEPDIDSTEAVADIFEKLINFSKHHFAFEERLMEEMDYDNIIPHKHHHDLFAKRISNYKRRFKKGDPITKELHSTVSDWLFNHIAEDDQSFADIKKQLEKKGKKGLLERLLKL